MAKKENSKSLRAEAKERENIHKKMVQEANAYAKVDKIAPNDSYIILKNVNKIYDNHVQAVYNFNLDIKEKEFIVFVGPSGCGKSTTLRMIAGLEDITYGDLFIGGKYCNITPPKDRNLAMVFQNYALYPHMSVYENMAFGIKLRKIPRQQFIPSEYDEIEEKLNAARATVAKLNLQERKGKRSKDEIDAERNAALAEINNLQEQLKPLEANRIPVMAIDEKKIKALEKEIENYNKLLVKFESADNLDEDEAVEMDAKKNDVQRALEKDNGLLEYYKTTVVPVYKYTLMKKYEIDEKIYNAARILDLREYLTRKPGALSGGQRQRVALGRAIVRNAGLFLMDEPLSNLDAKLRVQMRSEIVGLHNKLGATTIYVTHDQTEAMTMASRIVVMKDGHIQQIGTPIEIYDHPSNTFVAGFIGSPAMNIFRTSINGNTIQLTDTFSVTLDEEKSKAVRTYMEDASVRYQKKIDNVNRMIAKGEAKGNLSQGNRELFNSRIEKYTKALGNVTRYLNGETIDVEFGIRAEDIVTNADAGKFSELSPVYDANISVAEFLGHEYFVHFPFGENKIVAKVPVVKDLLKAGDVVQVMFNMEKAHLFEEDSKEAIF